MEYCRREYIFKSCCVNGSWYDLFAKKILVIHYIIINGHYRVVLKNFNLHYTKVNGVSSLVGELDTCGTLILNPWDLIMTIECGRLIYFHQPFTTWFENLFTPIILCLISTNVRLFVFVQSWNSEKVVDLRFRSNDLWLSTLSADITIWTHGTPFFWHMDVRIWHFKF